MSTLYDISPIAVPFLVFALLVFGLVRYSRALDTKITEHLGRRGFARVTAVPVLDLGGLGFEPRLCLRGPVAPGRLGTILLGFGRGPRRTAEATMTYARRFFYICVALPASPSLDDAWLARWTDTAHALRQPDGGVVVTWQLRDTVANVDRVLSELAAALEGRPEGSDASPPS